MNSHLKFYYGSMASAKTLRLLSTAYNFEEKNVQIMVLKPALDTRDGEGIIRSRAGLERKCVMIDKDMNLYKAIKAYKNVLAAQLETLKWVIIDECQFLTEDQVNQLSDVVDFLDVSVMCLGQILSHNYFQAQNAFLNLLMTLKRLSQLVNVVIEKHQLMQDSMRMVKLLQKVAKLRLVEMIGIEPFVESVGKIR